MNISYQKQWNSLVKKIDNKNLAHAFIFLGPSGHEKKRFCKELIKYLYCSEEKKPCQECFDCKMVEKETHPDLKIIKKADDKEEIEILQIKEIQNFLIYKPYKGFLKTVIIEDAHQMNQAAQSCFLKTLEEPRGRTTFFLLTSRLDFFLPTVLSRCQVVKLLGKISLAVEREKKIVKELKELINAQLWKKFKYIENLESNDISPLEILFVLEKHSRDLLMMNLGVEKIKKADNIFLENFSKYDIERIKNLIDLIEDISYKLNTTNVNPRLALERVFIEL